METKTITALKQQKRNSSRVNLYLDGEFAFGLEKIIAAWLSVGDQLSETQLLELQAGDSVEAGFQRGLHFISFRPRSIQETRAHLTRKGLQPAVIEAAIERLTDKNYLNDADFAAMWVENRIAFRPRSRFALRGELMKKGISDQIIETVLADLDDSNLAYRAAEKRVHRFAAYEWEDFRKKLMGFLGRRGFTFAVSDQVCRELWSQQQSKPQNA